MTTIAGIAFRHLDGLPKVGDIVLLDDLELIVLEMDAHRISRLRVRRITRPEESESMLSHTSDLEREMDESSDAVERLGSDVAADGDASSAPTDDPIARGDHSGH